MIMEVGNEQQRYVTNFVDCVREEVNREQDD